LLGVDAETEEGVEVLLLSRLYGARLLYPHWAGKSLLQAGDLDLHEDLLRDDIDRIGDRTYVRWCRLPRQHSAAQWATGSST
jgi:hypothetical protein